MGNSQHAYGKAVDIPPSHLHDALGRGLMTPNEARYFLNAAGVSMTANAWSPRQLITDFGNLLGDEERVPQAPAVRPPAKDI